MRGSAGVRPGGGLRAGLSVYRAPFGASVSVPPDLKRFGIVVVVAAVAGVTGVDFYVGCCVLFVVCCVLCFVCCVLCVVCCVLCIVCGVLCIAYCVSCIVYRAVSYTHLTLPTKA